MIRETSIEAYRDLIDRDVLGKRQAEVLEAMIKANGIEGAITANELYTGYLNRSGLTNSNIRARLTELRDMGSIEERAKRNCHITGQKVLTWHFTGAKPQKINRISKDQRKHIIKDFMASMLNEAKAQGRNKAVQDIKILWKMVNEL